MRTIFLLILFAGLLTGISIGGEELGFSNEIKDVKDFKTFIGRFNPRPSKNALNDLDIDFPKSRQNIIFRGVPSFVRFHLVSDYFYKNGANGRRFYRTIEHLQLLEIKTEVEADTPPILPNGQKFKFAVNFFLVVDTETFDRRGGDLGGLVKLVTDSQESRKLVVIEGYIDNQNQVDIRSDINSKDGMTCDVIFKIIMTSFHPENK